MPDFIWKDQYSDNVGYVDPNGGSKGIATGIRPESTIWCMLDSYLIHLPLDKMAVISQTIFSDTFY